MTRIAATILLTLLALAPQEAAAAGCYSTNYQKAEELFRQGSYSAAIKRYRAAKACPDKPKSNNIDARISECNRRLNPPKPTYYLTVDGRSSDFSVSLPARGGSRTFSVSTDSPDSWNMLNVPSWCSVSRSSSGFTLTCGDNRTTSSRSDCMYVIGGGKNVRVDISQPKQTVKIESFYVVHNQYQGGKKGMTIHLNITSDNIAKVGVYEIYLSRKNGAFVGRYCECFPLNPPISHKDFQVFIPYEKLNITAPGLYDIQGEISVSSNLEVICKDRKTFDFTYTP